jgi:hypothetical protein
MSEHMFNQVAKVMADMQADHDQAMAELATERGRLRAAADAALALHTPTYCDHSGGCINDHPHRVCDCCHVLWPCATVRALAPVADPGPHTTSDKET